MSSIHGIDSSELLFALAAFVSVEFTSWTNCVIGILSSIVEETISIIVAYAT